MTKVDDADTPQWLIEALHAVDTTGPIRTRMTKAGAGAYALAKMRAERAIVGFVPLSLGEYVEGLAALAGIRLEPLFSALGIGTLNPSNAATAERIGRLARYLGFRLDELIVSLRVGFAEQVAGAPLPMLAAHRGAPTATSPGECVHVLDQLQIGWPPELRSEMEIIRAAAAKGYRAVEEAEYDHGIRL